MKQEFEIEEEWINIEIHPDTPEKGVLLSEYFRGMDIGGMHDNLRRAGAAYGIEFGEMTMLANSHLAIAASEYARDHGKFEAFHEKVLHAYFTEARDIGDIGVLLEIATAVGLDRGELQTALETGRYEERLEQAQQEAMRYQVTGTPCFIINNRYKVSGAQPLDVFQNALRRIEQEEAGQA